MDLSLENEKYSGLKKVHDSVIEEGVEAEFSLPEYMPEILRIIMSRAVPKINSWQTVGERVTVDGSCELTMIYVGTDNCIYSFSTSRNFTRYCENSAFLNVDDVNINATVKFVNSRATSTKRAEIKAGISICVTAYLKEDEDILYLSEKCGIEKKQKEISAMSLGCKKSKMFSMSDNFTLDANTAAFIVRSNATAVLGEVRKIGSKIMLKGETIVEIAYIPHEDKTTVLNLRRILPINQILEFDGMEEHYTGDINLDITAVDVIIKNDSQGEGKSLDVGVTINAGITMWEQKDLKIITDAYAINGSIDLSYKTIKFYSALDAIRDTYIFKDTIDISKIGADCILDSFCDLSEPVVSLNDGVIAISGTLKATFILKDTSGGFVTTEKMLDYKYERTNADANKKIECTPNISVSSFECAVKNNEEIDIKAEMQINCSVFGEMEIDVVSAITEGAGCEKINNSAITVYFPNYEETLWDIAKRYNTTVESIVLENNLSGDTTKDVKMLFIPSAT